MIYYFPYFFACISVINSANKELYLRQKLFMIVYTHHRKMLPDIGNATVKTTTNNATHKFDENCTLHEKNFDSVHNICRPNLVLFSTHLVRCFFHVTVFKFLSPFIIQELNFLSRCNQLQCAFAAFIFERSITNISLIIIIIILQFF